MDIAEQTEAITLSKYNDMWKECKDPAAVSFDQNIPSNLNLPRTKDHNFDVGTGVNFRTGLAKSSPFNMDGYAKQSAKVADSDRIGQ